MANLTNGDRINLTGYDIVASASCDHGTVLVLTNNSSHFLVVDTEEGGTDGPDEHGRYIAMFNPVARVHSSHPYYHSIKPGVRAAAYRDALASMSERALYFTSDDDRDEAMMREDEA